jgi:hypothetical protein
VWRRLGARSVSGGWDLKAVAGVAGRRRRKGRDSTAGIRAVVDGAAGVVFWRVFPNERGGRATLLAATPSEVVIVGVKVANHG